MDWRGALTRLPGAPATAATAIGLCCRAAAWRPAVALLWDLQEHRARAETVACNAAIAACSRVRWQSSVQLLGAMQDLDVRVNSISLTSALSACKPRWRLASEALAAARSRGLRPNLFARSAAASGDGAGDGAAWRRAAQLAEADAVSVNGAVSACSRSRSWTEALALSFGLSSGGFRASGRSFASLAAAMQGQRGQWCCSLHVLRAAHHARLLTKELAAAVAAGQLSVQAAVGFGPGRCSWRPSGVPLARRPTARCWGRRRKAPAWRGFGAQRWQSGRMCPCRRRACATWSSPPALAPQSCAKAALCCWRCCRRLRCARTCNPSTRCCAGCRSPLGQPLRKLCIACGAMGWCRTG
ncbi:unnamed protein product [Effrenium voratum]|nr:unnamed protein product [Effrenium voratum]